MDKKIWEEQYPEMPELFHLAVEQAVNNDKYLEPIDYNAVYEVLDKEIENSRNWLRDAIEA